MTRLALQLTQDLLSPGDDLTGHPRHTRHMDTEAVLAAARHELPQEDHLPVRLLHRDVIVPDPGAAPALYDGRVIPIEDYVNNRHQLIFLDCSNSVNNTIC